MALIYITKQAYPELSPQFNSQNVTYVTVYTDDINKQLVFVDEKTDTELYRIPEMVFPPYKFYSAYLNQTGVTAPTTTNLNDSQAIGPIVDTIGGTWSYFGVGRYLFTKTGAFPDQNKVFVTLGANIVSQGADVGIKVNWIDQDTLELQTYIRAAFASPSALAYTDGIMVVQPIQIYVYE